VIVHDSGHVLRDVKFSLDEGPINDELRRLIRKLSCAPGFNLPAHWFEIPLHAVDADRDLIDEAKMLRVLRKDRREVAAERHLRTLG